MNNVKLVAITNILRYGSAFMIMVALIIAVVSIASSTKRRQVGELQKPSPPPSEASSDLGHMTQSLSGFTKLCFVRAKWIYLADLSTGKETKLVEGSVPDLSPMGNAIAFMSGSLGSADDAFRIKLLDLRTNQAKALSTIPHPSYNPRWSNNGIQIAFVVSNAEGTRLDIGMLNPTTGNWNNITKNLDLGNPNQPVYLDSWAADDQSILFHSLEDLYEVHIDGRLLQKIPINELCARSEISSATRFSLSHDKRYLLFDRIIDSPTEPENAIISVFDLNNKRLSQVTPKTIDAKTPSWLSTNEILFVCLKTLGNSQRPNICKVALDGTNLATLVSNADYPSSAR